ncbi:META domain-containing protein [Kaistella anthropi]|nr:META domain-containing protein [Kaistella anthropi]
MKNIFLSIFAAAALASCSSLSSTKVGGSQANIAGTKWILAEQVKGKTPTLNIETDKITGNGGCNSYFGEVLLDATAGNFSAKISVPPKWHALICLQNLIFSVC